MRSRRDPGGRRDAAGRADGGEGFDAGSAKLIAQQARCQLRAVRPSARWAAVVVARSGRVRSLWVMFGPTTPSSPRSHAPPGMSKSPLVFVVCPHAYVRDRTPFDWPACGTARFEVHGVLIVNPRSREDG